MTRISLLALALSISLPASIAFSESTVTEPTVKLLSQSSSWTNESGSIAQLTFNPSSSQPNTYIVSGSYVNNASGTGCQGTPYPISGVYSPSSSTISFSVNWSNSTASCNSTTGWTGYLAYENSTWTMTTDWNLSYQAHSGGAIQQGQDIFTMNTATIARSFLNAN